ncbi:hypothetical protein GCM10011415_36360 [Salipiger pallidus]|uniref:Uncharacterized protein n=1 Tax=Salipiger pallidus TaxID=1775170 RepID=A0A8J2ZMZ0_9RHOB|nr:hypothetical protein [Salipiger pallidus]GGG83246.1 hypothetical protein GCM10011415_36360 [Salipiger pallidus]
MAQLCTAVGKGHQRHIAWFLILRADWPARRAALVAWPQPATLDEHGRQSTRLPRA